jgi:hypothetical protein
MSDYERAVLISFAVGAVCILLWVAKLIAYPRITPLREKIDPPLPSDWLADRRSPEQRIREAGQ